MKFGRSILLLLFAITLPINAVSTQCAINGKCYLNLIGSNSLHKSNFNLDKTKECNDGICYAFKCIQSDGIIMHGSGCYEDFVNTCNNIQSKIYEAAKGSKVYKYYDENVIVVSSAVNDAPNRLVGYP
uniref:Uncharacterized protein n=1 Tax=Panagrolaimus sp. PS1159 TaxID=55785 RepID=A0AC35G2S4_9BILA